MKSFLIWLSGIFVGAGLGYGLGYLPGFNIFLSTAAGIIIGSSVGITINIYREREEELPGDKEPTVKTEKKSKDSKISQEAS